MIKKIESEEGIETGFSLTCSCVYHCQRFGVAASLLY